MAVDYKDYYKTLGVDRNASQKDIQKAFRDFVRNRRFALWQLHRIRGPLNMRKN